jgi:hypothetical protein
MIIDIIVLLIFCNISIYLLLYYLNLTQYLEIINCA